LFHKWLQWLSHAQLTEVADDATKLGMRIGLYLDVAVGEALDGSATWSNPRQYVRAASVGSPPDPMATEGQNWRLAVLRPTAIAEGSPAPFERMLDSVMRYAGAVRIDHAAALQRLFLVPLGEQPDKGAYVNYPQHDLLTVLAELSRKYNCIVIGEDLGNLPEGLQEALSTAHILSYRILTYEQTVDSFKLPEEYPTLALACVSTHDHQTFSGWWRGADIDMREKHELVSAKETGEHRLSRKRERRNLLAAFDKADIAVETAENPRLLTLAAHRFIARSSAFLASVRLADLTDETDPTNVPGTDASYPNWKPKLSATIEEVMRLPLAQAIVEIFASERNR